MSELKVEKSIEQSSGNELTTVEHSSSGKFAMQLNQVEVDSVEDFPDLQVAKVMPIDMGGNYWTPEKEGESKRVVFMGVKNELVKDFADESKLVEKESAIFVEQLPDKSIRTFCQSSSRLVSTFKSLPVRTAYIITYLGQTKNKTNAFKSFSWSVQPLVTSIQ